jgi:hypothetical protein
VAVKAVRACATRERADSGSSVEVLVTKEIRRGRRSREMLWSAGVLGDWRRRVRMHPAATLAVWIQKLALELEWGREGEKSYHAITQAIDNFVEEAGNEWFAG